MADPFTGDPQARHQLGTRAGEEALKGAAVEGDVARAFLALLPWLFLILIVLGQWLMTVVS